MRTQEEMRSFSAQRAAIMARCPKCNGASLSCECRRLYDFEVRCFESCVPRDFWHFDARRITHNVDVFDEVIKPYVAKVPIAHRVGAGLLLFGAQGCGKSLFLSWILVRILRSGLFSCYYTTMPDFASSIKKTWNDKTGELARRLETMICTSDFVVFDELGKEYAGAGDSFVRVEFERFMKFRFDASRPVLAASNSAPSDLFKDPEDGGYGETIRSIIEGRSKVVPMAYGDFRTGDMRDRVGAEMGWE